MEYPHPIQIAKAVAIKFLNLRLLRNGQHYKKEATMENNWKKATAKQIALSLGVIS